MKLFLSAFLCVALPATGLWLSRATSEPNGRPVRAATVHSSAKPYLRIGFAPEANIFAMRKGYRALADYLETKLAGEKGARVSIELVTATSYAGMLRDFGEGRIDAAFMGSLAALVATDRRQGEVYLKSQGRSGKSTYSGVVFVLEGSPCEKFEDLGGKRLGAVRTTMGGAVFPLYLMRTKGMFEEGKSVPRLVWSGTHDDVIQQVVAGQLDGGAVKDLRLLAYEREHPEVRFRKLEESERAPDNALVIRTDYPEDRREALVMALESMHADPGAKGALGAMGVERYLPCDAGEYAELYEMVEGLRGHWVELNIEGAAPRRPSAGELHGVERGKGG